MKYFIYVASKLEPIFYHLVYMSIVALIIGIVILIIKKIASKKISPKWISRIWLIFIISLIIPVTFKCKISIYNILPDMQNVFSNINYSKQAETIEQYKQEIVKEYESEAPNISPEDNVFKFSREDLNDSMKEFDKVANQNYLFVFLPIIWVGVVFILVVIYIVTYIIFEIKLHKSVFIKNHKINSVLEESKNKLKIKTKIKLINQNIINMPSIFGIFNIRILVNDELLNLSDKEIEYVLMHELAHYKRKDNWLNILITILKVIYIFNPIIIILLDKLKKDIELATDELAMQYSNEEQQKEYSKTLVMLSAMNSDKYLMQTLCLVDEKRNLERRIDNINLLNNFKKNKKIITVISILLLLFVILVFCTENSNYMSKNEIIKLVENAYNHNNYFVQVEQRPVFNDENLKEFAEQYIMNMQFYYKDNISVFKSNTAGNNEFNIISYNNYNTKENVTIYTSDNEKSVSTYNSNSDEKIDQLFIKGLENADSYKFCGEGKINEKDVYILEITSFNSYSYDLTHNIFGINDDKNIFTVYIEKQTGLILKVEYNYFYKNEKKSNFVGEYNYKFDMVTDEDIKWPDLNEYKDYEINISEYVNE